MKNIILSITLLLFSTLVFAQAPVTAEQKAEETVTKLKTDLALTDEQVPKVKTITVDRINKITAAKKKNGADKPRMQADSKRIFEEWQTQLKGILTEAQFSNYSSKK